eukprot:CAMPEP_0169418480 /NCGR_PEP_ID=MMETSP1017-20121227/64341_1 /TAXON_ID=342587 /ORGANISM="Karlodinium micrum, Strain CCMP2283" /LENGTH=195 /DNA_ID=CAMNT_0009526823 /DNA_START=83 /DNA_END=667 /DNA_ORIENTATION=-
MNASLTVPPPPPGAPPRWSKEPVKPPSGEPPFGESSHGPSSFGTLRPYHVDSAQMYEMVTPREEGEELSVVSQEMLRWTADVHPGAMAEMRSMLSTPPGTGLDARQRSQFTFLWRPTTACVCATSRWSTSKYRQASATIKTRGKPASSTTLFTTRAGSDNESECESETTSRTTRTSTCTSNDIVAIMARCITGSE